MNLIMAISFGYWLNCLASVEKVAYKGLHTPGNFVACNSCNQVVTRVKQLCYRADTTLLQLLQATKLPGVWRP